MAENCRLTLNSLLQSAPSHSPTSLLQSSDDGVGDGNRTHNVRSHSPVLCQLSYSHRIFVIITTRVGSCQTQADEEKNKLRERGRERRSLARLKLSSGRHLRIRIPWRAGARNRA